MRYCNRCGEAVLELKVLRHNYGNYDYEEVQPRYCPFCAEKYELPVMPLNGKLGSEFLDFDTNKND